MTGVFKANHPTNNIVLFVYALLLKLPMFFDPVVPKVQSFDGFLFRSLLKSLQGIGTSFPLIYQFIAFILLITQALTLNVVVNNQKLLQKPNYLTAMSYILVTSLFTEWNNLSAPLIINSIMIWVLAQLCKLHNHSQPKSILFNIGLAVGVNAFFYFPSLSFLILIIVGLSITRAFRIREWLMILLGTLTPFYFAAAYFFLTEKWEQVQLPFLKLTVPHLKESTWAVSGMILIGIAVLVGAVFIQNNLRKQLVQTRKSWALVFLYLLVAIFVPFINATEQFDYWILSAVPIAGIMASAFLYPERKWFAHTVHWGLVVLIVLMGYFIQ